MPATDLSRYAPHLRHLIPHDGPITSIFTLIRHREKARTELDTAPERNTTPADVAALRATLDACDTILRAIERDALEHTAPGKNNVLTHERRYEPYTPTPPTEQQQPHCNHCTCTSTTNHHDTRPRATYALLREELQQDISRHPARSSENPCPCGSCACNSCALCCESSCSRSAPCGCSHTTCPCRGCERHDHAACRECRGEQWCCLDDPYNPALSGGVYG
jgi:hypothetical protein